MVSAITLLPAGKPRGAQNVALGIVYNVAKMRLPCFCFQLPVVKFATNWGYDDEYHWALAFAKAGANEDAFACMENSYAKYVRGAEKGHANISELHKEIIQWEMTREENQLLDSIRRNYCVRITRMLADLDREFPDSFKADGRYQLLIEKFRNFVQIYRE